MTSSARTLDPSERAVVMCVDEKTQIQVFGRTASILPIRPGVLEEQTYDYRRHGTTHQGVPPACGGIAALDVATGEVTDRCYDRYYDRYTAIGTYIDGWTKSADHIIAHSKPPHRETTTYAHH